MSLSLSSCRSAAGGRTHIIANKNGLAGCWRQANHCLIGLYTKRHHFGRDLKHGSPPRRMSSARRRTGKSGADEMNWTEPPFDENLVADTEKATRELIRRLRDLRAIGRQLAERSNSKRRMMAEGGAPKPCSHPGCTSHVSHPCEGCGRIWGRTNDMAWIGIGNPDEAAWEIWAIHSVMLGPFSLRLFKGWLWGINWYGWSDFYIEIGRLQIGCYKP